LRTKQSSRRKGRAEFADDEGVQGAEAGGKLGGGQAALAMEPTEMISGGKVTFAGVTFLTAGDEVAVGIILQLDAGDYMVEAARRSGKSCQTIKTTTAFSHMDGPAQGWTFQEVQHLEIVVAGGT
jgi:hypothetical protein